MLQNDRPKPVQGFFWIQNPRAPKPRRGDLWIDQAPGRNCFFQRRGLSW